MRYQKRYELDNSPVYNGFEVNTDLNLCKLVFNSKPVVGGVFDAYIKSINDDNKFFNLHKPIITYNDMNIGIGKYNDGSNRIDIDKFKIEKDSVIDISATTKPIDVSIIINDDSKCDIIINDGMDIDIDKSKPFAITIMPKIGCMFLKGTNISYKCGSSSKSFTVEEDSRSFTFNINVGELKCSTMSISAKAVEFDELKIVTKLENCSIKWFSTPVVGETPKFEIVADTGYKLYGIERPFIELNNKKVYGFNMQIGGVETCYMRESDMGELTNSLVYIEAIAIRAIDGDVVTNLHLDGCTIEYTTSDEPRAGYELLAMLRRNDGMKFREGDIVTVVNNEKIYNKRIDGSYTETVWLPELIIEPGTLDIHGTASSFVQFESADNENIVYVYNSKDIVKTGEFVEVFVYPKSGYVLNFESKMPYIIDDSGEMFYFEHNRSSTEGVTAFVATGDKLSYVGLDTIDIKRVDIINDCENATFKSSSLKPHNCEYVEISIIANDGYSFGATGAAKVVVNGVEHTTSPSSDKMTCKASIQMPSNLESIVLNNGPGQPKFIVYGDDSMSTCNISNGDLAPYNKQIYIEFNTNEGYLINPDSSVSAGEIYHFNISEDRTHASVTIEIPSTYGGSEIMVSRICDEIEYVEIDIPVVNNTEITCSPSNRVPKGDMVSIEIKAINGSGFNSVKPTYTDDAIGTTYFESEDNLTLKLDTVVSNNPILTCPEPSFVRISKMGNASKYNLNYNDGDILKFNEEFLIEATPVEGYKIGENAYINFGGIKNFDSISEDMAYIRSTILPTDSSSSEVVIVIDVVEIV